MSKHHIKEDKNARIVLFEKNQFYYYKTSASDFSECIEKCMVLKNNIRIGSNSCRECIYNRGQNINLNGKGFILCKRLYEAIR